MYELIKSAYVKIAATTPEQLKTGICSVVLEARCLTVGVVPQ